MNRAELQQRIAELDRSINAEFEKINMKSELPKIRPFPKWDWILAVLCFAWTLFAGDVSALADVHAKSQDYVFYAGIFFGAVAILRTILWFFSLLTRRSTHEFGETSAHVRALQDERRELQRQLREMEM